MSNSHQSDVKEVGERPVTENEDTEPDEEDNNDALIGPPQAVCCGKKHHLLQMVILISIPTITLIIQVSTLLAQQVIEFQQRTEARNKLFLGMGMSSVVHGLQDERDTSAFFVGDLGLENKDLLMNKYRYTDKVILSLEDDLVREKRSAPTSYLQSSQAFISYLNAHRYQLDMTGNTLLSEIKFYSTVMKTATDWYMKSIKETSTGNPVWKLLVSMNEIMDNKEEMGQERAFGTWYFVRAGFDDVTQYTRFTDTQHADLSTAGQSNFFSYVPPVTYRVAFANITAGCIEDLSDMRSVILGDPYGRQMIKPTIRLATAWYEKASLFIGALLYIQKNLTSQVMDRLSENVDRDENDLIWLGLLFVVSLVIGPVVLHSAISLTLQRELDNQKLLACTTSLDKEISRSNILLTSLMPRRVAHHMKNEEKNVAEMFSEVTIFIGKIVGFSRICSRSSPLQVINIMDNLYACFDEVCQKYEVYKMETVDDTFRIVSEITKNREKNHAREICTMALNLLDAVSELGIPHMPGNKLKLRIGCHTGPIVCGIVGKAVPRYSLFGDTLLRTINLEKTGHGKKIHISECTLKELGSEYITECRENAPNLVGNAATYWLLDNTNMSRDRVDDSPLSSDYELSHTENSNYGDELLSVGGEHDNSADDLEELSC